MADMQQSLRQASVRAVTSTTLTYEGDWHALWDTMGIAVGPFNQRLLAYINQQLSASYTELNGAMAAFAAANGATTFQAIGTFTPTVSLTAPENLAFVSATDPDSDNTQALLVTVTSPEVGDEIVFNASLGAFGTANDPAEFDVTDAYTIQAADLIDLEGEITLTLTPDGEWFIRAFHKRGSTYSLASNTISKTITTTSKLLLVNGTDHLLLVNGTDRLLLAA